MKKAVISNRIFLSVTPELKESLNKELTYSIPSYNPNDPPFLIKNMARINDGLVSIPAGRLDLIPADYQIIEKRVLVPVKFPTFKFTLRDSQQEVYDSVDDSCMINAWVSWGKTFCALAIAGKLGQKTLVITHTVALRDQWVREIEKVYGFTPDIIGSGAFGLSTPIVVGNVQTLSKHVDKIKKEFGTIILDEFHHCSAPTFSNIINACYSRYKIGLSGTIERKDGKHVVFRDYFGSRLYQPTKENFITPVIHVYEFDIRFADGEAHWADKVTQLSQNPDYRKSISLLASYYASHGHKVLIVGDRVEFLHACAHLSGEKAICVTGGVLGVKHQDRETLINRLDEDADMLYGTQSIFSEGFSKSILSCLILGTPINNEPLLTQLIGRVIRKSEGKTQPIIVDIHLKGNTAKRQAMNRIGYYMKQGYEIIYH